jgi:uncharacterized protein (DUF1501 family)
MKRRNFIKNSTMGLGVLSNLKIDGMHLNAFQPPLVGEENDNVLVVIQLGGGNDGLNTITPYEWESYYTLYRPSLHIPKNVVSVIDKARGMAMHPNLKLGVNQGLLGLLNEGKLAIINGVGYHNPNYSHFRSTDIWLSGVVPNTDSTPLNSGWLGRYAENSSNFIKKESPFCVQIGQNPSLMFMGEKAEQSIVLESPEDLFHQAKSVEAEKISLGGGSYFLKEFDYLNEVGIQVNEYSKVIKKAFDAGKNIESYTNKTLSNQLKLVARLIDGGLKTKVYFVELHGFDTHANQGGLDGTHSRLLAELSEAISAFQADIDKLGHTKKVLGITVSEFGRRLYENGSSGTDHGTANLMFAFGEPVRGGIIGNYFGFLPQRDNNNLWYSYDFRSIYYEIMVTWFGKNPAFAAMVLGEKFAYVEQKGFLKNTIVDITLPPPPAVPQGEPDANGQVNPAAPRVITEQDAFTLYPNPVEQDAAFIGMTLYYQSDVTITQSTLKGQVLGEIHRKKYKAGLHNVYVSLLGGPGLYILKIKVNNRYHFLKALKL